MLPLEFFYVKIPSLALNKEAKKNPQLSLFISADPEWQAKQTGKTFCSLLSSSSRYLHH